MLFFQWERIDWIKWMPVEVGVLLVLIIFIRLLRRFRRWNRVETSHVSISNWQLGNFSGNLYQNQLNPNFPSEIPVPKHSREPIKNPSEKKSILLISPVQASAKVESLMASSLALAGSSVFSISPKKFYKIIGDPLHAGNFFTDFIKKYSVKTVVLFDHAIFPYFSCFLGDDSLSSDSNFHSKDSKPELFPNLNYILVRPLWTWNEIRNWFRLLINPLQALYYLHLLPYKGVYKSRLGSSQIAGIDSVNASVNQILCIYPAKSWLKTGADDKVNSWADSIEAEVYNFSEGDWWFFRNETILIGIMADFIHRTA